MQMYTVDEVYDVIGHLGKAQFIYFIHLSLVHVLIGEHMLLNIYTGLEPSFKCHFSQEGKGEVLTNQCPNNTASHCKLDFIEEHSTYISEWKLVCDKKYKVALVQSIWMAGVMVGALLLSNLADRFGRLKALTISVLGSSLFDAMAAFAPSYLAMVFFRFLAGIFCALVIVVSFVLSQELIGLRWRSTCAILMATFFSFGIGLLSAFAAYIADWRSLTLVTSLSGAIFLVITCFVPESPRWLVGKGRIEDANKVLEMIAVRNGTAHLLPHRWSVRSTEANSRSPHKRGLFATIFSHHYLIYITLIQVFSWFVNSAVYYALTMSAASATQGNVYWATSVNGLIEIPASVSSIFLIERYGRRFTICFFMLTGGFVCVIIPIMPVAYVNTLALLGKLGVSASFSVIYLHSGEIFPTMIRNTAMGMLSVSARIGGIVAPFVMMAGDIYPNSHFVILGSLAFLSGLLNTKLPETLGLPLPETISEVIALRDRRKNKDKGSLGGHAKGYKKSPEDVEETEDEDSSVEESKILPSIH